VKIKLWIGGEICAEVADSFRHARIIVEKAVNDAISEKTTLLILIHGTV
jgi:hypothetical protein